jgi:hypothetical protein
MRRILMAIYQVPILGDGLCFVGYAVTLAMIPITYRLSRGTRTPCGTSVFWMPRGKERPILAGIECLRDRDADLFSKLSGEARLIFVYAGNTKTPNNGTRLYCIHERFIEMGPEGVALFLAQSLFFHEASPSWNQCRLSESQEAAVRAAPRRALVWMSQHSFYPGLVDSYREVVENWEQSERFRNLAVA